MLKIEGLKLAPGESETIELYADACQTAFERSQG